NKFCYHSPFFTFLFFFCCPAPHRDLPSFPTRRSSDLRQQHPLHLAGGIQGYGEVHPFYLAPLPGPVDIAHWNALREHAFEDHGLDRKSTRLNSSHVKISYAVFCLKKKKQQHTCRHTIR